MTARGLLTALSRDAPSSSVTEHLCRRTRACLGGERDLFEVTLYFQNETYNFNELIYKNTSVNSLFTCKSKFY